ncbi:hypothetical protein [Cumulibacter manganitolerans]|uniref:hypothetical protein n=1 Tax=Cumulibacter manganitolerans TaxID=1884992 RepID=UPI0012958555|nr:hypothetical protein [Cumulibacter manganitolerans]
MHTNTWTVLTRDGQQHTRAIQYDTDLAALVVYSEAINAISPLPVDARPGEYLHVRVQLEDCLVVAQWHHVNAGGELVLTPEDDVLAQLTDHLIDQISDALH